MSGHFKDLHVYEPCKFPGGGGGTSIASDMDVRQITVWFLTQNLQRVYF